MKAKIISAADIVKEVVRELGFNPDDVTVTSIEVLSSLIRRTAGLLCPCPRQRLLKNILQSLEGIVQNHMGLRDSVDETIDSLVAHGDLVEHDDISREFTRSAIVLNRAPLSFIRRSSGACILLGVAPDGISLLPDFLQEKILYNNFSRVIPADAADDDVSQHLLGLGFVELPYKAWLKCPSPTAPDKYIASIDHYLSSSLANSTSAIEGLRILDPSTTIEYYPDRWVMPKEHTGRFIGRRPQAYGADLWCYVELEYGQPSRFLDLPLPGSRWRGCDEAWQLQAAIDASNRRPQQYEVRDGASGLKILCLFLPMPSWIQRRWALVGTPVPRYQCLTAFRFRTDEIEEEIRFAKEHLWLSERIRNTV